jgi:hypothetical protein
MSSRTRQAGTRALRGCWTVVVLTALGCATPRDTVGDSATTLPAIDTLKPAPDTVAARDSVPATTKTSPTNTTRATKTVPTASKSRDSIIGRDVAIPLDPKKPKLDTVKRPPQR